MWYKKRKFSWWLRLVWLVFVLAIITLVFWFNQRQTAIPSFDEQIEQSLVDAKIVPIVNNVDTVLTDMPPATEQSQPAVSQQLVVLDVPFVSQAPYAEWEDDRFQDGCEEASALMAMRWVNHQTLSKAEAKEEIIKMAAWQSDQYDNYHDTNAADTVARLFNGYFNYSRVKAINNPKISDIKTELYVGNLVLVPTDGRRLNNPYYTPPGPSTHMLVIKGYDPQTEEFITNDPGTKRGQDYRYNTSVLWEGILDYPTGNHEPIQTEAKAMIVVSPGL